MATKRTWNPRAELRALNYMIRVLIVTHPDRAKLVVGKGILDVESAMLVTTTSDDLIEQVKELSDPKRTCIKNAPIIGMKRNSNMRKPSSTCHRPR